MSPEQLNKRMKMASRSLKHTMTMYFCDMTEKNAFTARLKRICERFTPPRENLVSYQDLMLRMFDAVKREATQATEAAEPTSMLRNGGKCLQ
jgi:hypothetical protein